MRIAYLGSGSRGNAAIIEANDTRIMLDCGFSAKEAERRLERLELAGDDVDALLVTHEHSDHISGVGTFARRFNVPVWMTSGTLATRKSGKLPDVNTVLCDTGFGVGGISITPVAVPHDAREPCQYVFSDGQHKLGILTDVGHITPHILRNYANCDALILECNHDEGMLRDGPYPWALKKRVGGNYGHLNNGQAAAMLESISHDKLQWVMAVHVSEKNNTGALALSALEAALGGKNISVHLADQDDGTPWQDVNVTATDTVAECG